MVYIIILFLSNSLNMLHLEFLTRSIRPNGHTPVQQCSLQAKKMTSSPSLQLTKIIVLVTIDTQRPVARDYMYYDECIGRHLQSCVFVASGHRSLHFRRTRGDEPLYSIRTHHVHDFFTFYLMPNDLINN